MTKGVGKLVSKLRIHKRGPKYRRLEIMDLPDDEIEEFEPARRRDPKIDEAKSVLITELFSQQVEEVFYGQQVEILFEDRFFHWITGRALNELVTEHKIQTVLLPLIGAVNIRFYWSPRNRYWRRRAAQLRKLVREFSDPTFTDALGRHGEMMIDAALPRFGFLPKDRDVRAYCGREWTMTGHDLDRVFERDSIAYGTEIKNTLPYITRHELQIKLQMCQHLAIRPLFVFRFAPKSYVHLVRQHGGFTLLLKWQLYPFGYHELARRVKSELGLPTDCPAAIQEGTIKRFLNWHLAHLP